MADWFAPKRRGYGSGRPIAWQGWVALALFIAITIATTQIFHDKPLIMFSILVPVVGVFLLVAARNTRGGWRWRNGDER